MEKVVAEQVSVKASSSLRHLLRNHARNWGKVVSMSKHLPGVWWFCCEGEEGRCDGFIVCERDFSMKDFPEAPNYRIGKLRGGAGIYAFVEGIAKGKDGDAVMDEADHLLLQWWSEPLARAIFEKGYEKKGPDEFLQKLATTGITIKEEGEERKLVGYPAYRHVLEKVVSAMYPEES